jgi:hypothetical protein
MVMSCPKTVDRKIPDEYKEYATIVAGDDAAHASEADDFAPPDGTNSSKNSRGQETI